MDPHAAGHLEKYEPVQTQPQWQSMPPPSHQSQLYNPTAVVPAGLERLVEVEEVILQKKVFFTRSEQTLFTVRRESECCGPGFNLRFQDPYKRDVVSLYADSGEDCCGGETHLKITVFPECTIGFVKISNSSQQMSVSIQMEFGEPAFTAELSLSYSQNIIEIRSVHGSCPVATITTEGENKSSKVVFQFPMDMEATLKTLILAAFLYLKYEVARLSSSSDSSHDSGWDTAGGEDFDHDDDHHSWGHGGFDGDCGGGDFGAFFTRSGQTLFTLHFPTVCCGPSFDLKFRDPYKRNVVSLIADSSEYCFRRQTSPMVVELPDRTIGFVTVSHTHKMSFSIHMTSGQPAFTAELPFSTQDTIEIISVKRLCPVAKITKEEGFFSKAIIEFPNDMEATLKAVILAALLYMIYLLNIHYSSSITGWCSVGNLPFHDVAESGDLGG